MFFDYMFTVSQYAVIILSVTILIRCLRSMLSERITPEIWAYIRVGHETLPVYHWENIIGKARSADIRVFGKGIGRVHAVLKRADSGIWYVYDVFAKGGVWVNGERVPGYGTALAHGDIINLGGSCVRFLNISPEKCYENEAKRLNASYTVNPAVTMAELSILQLALLFQHTFTASSESMLLITMSYMSLIILEWAIYEAMRLINRTGFEIEILSFYLTTLGLCVAASSTPEDVFKQILLIISAIVLFLFSGWWMRNLKRTSAFRIPVAIMALALMAVNIFTSDSINGAQNWLTFGGYSFQPSELVKAFYIYVGAATLETLYRRGNLYSFIGFSAICVVALAMIGDFGTALIFFVTFLVISFMRSGSIATVLLAVSGAVMAGFLAVSIKPYIARRFEIWGHAWEDVYDAGYQQTRAMSAAASGGMLGKGAGGGWLKNIFASNTDMVFAYVCEELGLIVAVCMVAAVLLMALFAVRMSLTGRSSYYAIAGCATSAMLLVQLALNVFGSLDILPFTGVTFPFVSRGGSSLISCWMLMAYLKSTDNRMRASFAVTPAGKMRRAAETESDEDEENADEAETEDMR